MTDSPDSDNGLDTADREFGELLQSQRPVPAPRFRGALGRHLAVRDPGYGPRPARLRLIASAYVGAGAVVLALGALQATGRL